MSAALPLPGPSIRLIADDLTGALDAAAEFVGHGGPVRVAWGRLPASLSPRFAFDIATREGTAEAAALAAAAAARSIVLAGADIAFLKVDSLLRGHAVAEIAACRAVGGFDAIVIAPAFPFQGRATVGGRQCLRREGAWAATGEDLVAGLDALGSATVRARPGDLVPIGISLWDAETDADLAAIVAAGRAAERDGLRLLWVGSGGLAGALAQQGGATSDAAPPALDRPVLGLFGTDHAVTMGQLDRAGRATLRLPDAGEIATARLMRRLRDLGAALVAFDLPTLDRAEAARRIAAEMATLVDRLDPPATLVCAGGETLRAVCEALGTEALDIVGRIVPGVPVSTMVGGRWDGVRVVSKSGAFGAPDFLARLIASVPDGRSAIGTPHGAPLDETPLSEGQTREAAPRHHHG